jgi:hypothetical protein
MSRTNRPGLNEEIARMLTEGATRKAITKALKVGFARISRVEAALAGGLEPGEGAAAAEVNADDEPASFDDLHSEVMDQRPTVIVDADYLRALEAMLFLVEQNRALRAAMEAA